MICGRCGNETKKRKLPDWIAAKYPNRVVCRACVAALKKRERERAKARERQEINVADVGDVASVMGETS